MKTRLKLTKGFIAQKIGADITLISGEQNKIYTLNETASFIYQGIKKGMNPEDIAKNLSKEYQIEVTKATKDVDKVVTFFILKKILCGSE